MDTEYRYEARSIIGFIAQIVRYASSGYFQCVRITIPEHKDPKLVDAKLMELYEIGKKPWQRKKRYRKDNAVLHYLRYKNLAVMMSTNGVHLNFQSDQKAVLLNLRRNVLRAYGYSIRLGKDPETNSKKVFVRLDQKIERRIKSQMTKIAVWDCYRDPKRLEREISRLPYQAYAPVYAQLKEVVELVNKARRKRGFAPVSDSCVCKFRKLEQVFIDDNKTIVVAG